MNKQNNDQIISKVKEALTKSAEQIKGADIFVSAEGGRVTLKGVVDSNRERDKAVEIAKSVEGVTSVDEEFRIMADQSFAGLQDNPAMPGFDNANSDQGCSPSPRVG